MSFSDCDDPVRGGPFAARAAEACRNYSALAGRSFCSIFNYRRGSLATTRWRVSPDSRQKGFCTMLPRSHSVAARRRRTLDALVCHVAEASVDAICRLVRERVEPMGPAEARGYVRARGSRNPPADPAGVLPATWRRPCLGTVDCHSLHRAGRSARDAPADRHASRLRECRRPQRRSPGRLILGS